MENRYDDLELHFGGARPVEIEQYPAERSPARQKRAKTGKPKERASEKRITELLADNSKLRVTLRDAVSERNDFSRIAEMFQTAFEGLEEPFIILSRDMKIKMINQAASARFGLSTGLDVAGRSCFRVFHDRASPCENCIALTAISSGKAAMMELNDARGPGTAEMLCAYPLKTQDGEWGDIVIRIPDITERKLFEKQLFQSEKMAGLGLLISSIAHEINNPNTFISFNIPILRTYFEELMSIVDLYVENQPGLEIMYMPFSDFRQDVFRLLDNVEHGSKRICVVISALRRFSHVRKTRDEEWVDLKSIIESALAICGMRLRKKVKSIIVEIPENLPQIYTDPDSIEQVIVNLLVNAADASQGKGSWIKLKVANGSSWLEHTIIDISDNGCGMDEKTLGRIFEPFYTTKSRSDGTGLGLYVCKDLVESLRGRMEVESRPGVGSTFRVILPDGPSEMRESLNQDAWLPGEVKNGL